MPDGGGGDGKGLIEGLANTIFPGEWRTGRDFLYTILTILGMILFEVLGSEGEDDLGNGGSSSSSSSRRGRQIFRGNW